MELATLPNVEVVQADSLDADSLSEAMEVCCCTARMRLSSLLLHPPPLHGHHSHRTYPSTYLPPLFTGRRRRLLMHHLEQPGAGTWTMGWDGGKYEVDQGVAFAKAAQRIETLKQVDVRHRAGAEVAGGVPRRAADPLRGEVENRGDPSRRGLTSYRGIRKYLPRELHQAYKAAHNHDGEGDGNSWEPGTYFIKALTPSDFEYNMLGPGDIGAWALLALEVSSSKHAPSMQQSTLLPFLPPFC